MKKTYCAPMIEFEDFTLCTNIAAGCENKANFVQNVCGYALGGDRFNRIVFVSASTNCNYTEVVVKEEDGSPSYNGICYHVPTESNNLFAS